MKIEYRFNRDSLFDGQEGADTDVSASCDAFADTVLKALEKVFPEADIEVEQGGFVPGSPARVDYETDSDAAELVADIAEDIWGDMQWVVFR